MTIQNSDFFVQDTSVAELFEPVEPAQLDRQRLTRLIERPDPTAPDVDVALALMDLVRDDLQKSGTEGGQLLDDGEMRFAMRALQRVSARAGHEGPARGSASPDHVDGLAQKDQPR